MKECHYEEAYDSFISGGDWIAYDHHDEIMTESINALEKNIKDNYKIKLEIINLTKQIELLTASTNAYKIKIEKGNEILMCQTLIKDTERIIKEDIDKTYKYNKLVEDYNQMIPWSSDRKEKDPMELNY